MGKKVPKKRTWRKADIKDVEEGLEENRAVKKLKRSGPEPTKGADGEAAPDGELDELFTIDTAGSGEGLSKKTKRELARARLFPPKGPNLGLSASEHGKVARAEAIIDGPKKVSQPKVTVDYDLWAAPTAIDKAFSPAQKIFAQIRRPKYAAVKKPHFINQKTSKAPAVVPAHEGQSMNPELSAYEDLACTAAARQIEKEREIEDLDRKIKPMTMELRDATDFEELKGMSEEQKVARLRSLICKPAAENGGDTSTGSHLEHRVKSQARKNKDARRKVTDEEARQEKDTAKLEKSVGDLPAIMKSLQDEEKLQKSRREYRKARKDEQQRLESTKGIVPKRRRLGKSLFEEHALMVPDAVAAAKGLRCMPLSKGGSAIHERIASIVRRGMLPANPEATRQEGRRLKKKNMALKRRRKPISPLLRDNLCMSSLGRR